MAEVRELTCIGCPMGCQLTVTLEADEVTSVTGNTCQTGDKYARKEVTDPRRTVTSTVKVKQGDLRVVSVKTATDIPKNKIFDCMSEIAKIELVAPVSVGDIVIDNVADTGVAVIATNSVSREK